MNVNVPKEHRARAFFYLFASFFSGFIVMLVELAGVRLLSPVFGNSIYTWTALIAVVLLALSVGNAIGGWLADRGNALQSLHIALIVSAIATMALPGLSGVMVILSSGLGPIAGPMLFCMCLFIVPATAFGMISPIALRLLSTLSRDKHIGFVGGLINSSSAIGSVIGTIVTGFILVRYLGVKEIYFLSSVCIVIVAVASMRLHRTSLPAKVRAHGFILLVCSAVISNGHKLSAHSHEIWRDLSYYNLVQVLDIEHDHNKHYRYLLNDGAPQGVMDINTGMPTSTWQRIWRLIELQESNFELSNALIVGGGSFGVPQMMSQRWPDATFHVIEIDQSNVDAANTWFNLTLFDNISTTVGDARLFLNNHSRPEGYEFVYLDAYGSKNTVPAHLLTVEFFQKIHEQMAPGGYAMMNLISSLDKDNSELFNAVFATTNSVFKHIQIYEIDHAEPGGISNVFFLMGDSLKDTQKRVSRDTELTHLASLYVEPDLYASNDGFVITDNFHPIENMVVDMKHRGLDR